MRKLLESGHADSASCQHALTFHMEATMQKASTILSLIEPNQIKVSVSHEWTLRTRKKVDQIVLARTETFIYGEQNAVDALVNLGRLQSKGASAWETEAPTEIPRCFEKTTNAILHFIGGLLQQISTKI